MPFTDDDLKRLKNKPHNPHEDRAQITHGDLMALLARLEVAELVCSEVGEMQEWRWSLKKAMDTWRKTYGK